MGHLSPAHLFLRYLRNLFDHLRETTSILLLFILFVPFPATFFWLEYQKSMVKHEVKWRMIEGLEKEELVLLKFTKEEAQNKLRWEHSREFEYNGQMYDIVDTQIKGDTLYYWCWWDHEETVLNKKLDELMAKAFGHDPQQRKSQSQLQRYLKSFFWPVAFQWEASNPEKPLHKPYYNYRDHYASLYLVPQKPPPQIV